MYTIAYLVRPSLSASVNVAEDHSYSKRGLDCLIILTGPWSDLEADQPGFQDLVQ